MDVILENIKALAPIPIVLWIWLLIRTVRKPQRYFNSILLMTACFFTLLFISGLFGDYMGYAMLSMFLLGMLALFLVPILLIANGIQMIRRESCSLGHLLSLLLGIGIGIGEIAAVAAVLGWGEFRFFRQIDTYAIFLAATVFYFSCLLLNFVVYSVFIQLIPHRANYDYIIIHGCGLSGGCRVTKLLSDRIDKAIEVFRKCQVKPYIIASGGRGDDEKLSEAQAIADYLIAHGIPEESVIREDGSATTMENLVNSQKIIEERGGGKRTALVSSNYHVYRCLMYAKALKMDCVGIGARVALYYWPSALIREFAAVFREKHFLILSLIGYVLFLLPMLGIARYY